MIVCQLPLFFWKKSEPPPALSHCYSLQVATTIWAAHEILDLTKLRKSCFIERENYVLLQLNAKKTLQDSIFVHPSSLPENFVLSLKIKQSMQSHSMFVVLSNKSYPNLSMIFIPHARNSKYEMNSNQSSTLWVTSWIICQSNPSGSPFLTYLALISKRAHLISDHCIFYLHVFRLSQLY